MGCSRGGELGDVLDQPSMVRYLKTYQRHLEGEPAIWGLHNYSDTNRCRSTGLNDMLAAVTGEIWITETGGLVQLARMYMKLAISSSRRAARSARPDRRVD